MGWTGWLHFLNLQYWYCLIYSLFGGHCADSEVPAPPPDEQGYGAFHAFISGVWTGILVFWHAISGVATWLWHLFSAVSYAYSGIVALAIATALAGLMIVRFREVILYGTLPPAEEKDDSRLRRWKELLTMAMSTDPKAWKAAIVEADHMLGDLLALHNYQGMNTAERMRALPESAFSTVPVAWEAHRIKNMITANASDFILTQREAFRVMKLYEQVFEEFHYL